MLPSLSLTSLYLSFPSSLYLCLSLSLSHSLSASHRLFGCSILWTSIFTKHYCLLDWDLVLNLSVFSCQFGYVKLPWNHGIWPGHLWQKYNKKERRNFRHETSYEQLEYDRVSSLWGKGLFAWQREKKIAELIWVRHVQKFPFYKKRVRLLTRSIIDFFSHVFVVTIINHGFQVGLVAALIVLCLSFHFGSMLHNLLGHVLYTSAVVTCTLMWFQISFDQQSYAEIMMDWNLHFNACFSCNC